MSERPYLRDVHAPVSDELEVATLDVEGELPRELCGMFVRNTPNPQFEPIGRHHWFDGDGMVHGVRFDGGRASYVNKWIRTPGFNYEREAGHAIWTGIHEPIKRDAPIAPLKDTANTDLVFHNQKLLALWWLSGTPQRLSPTDLSTLGPETFGGKLTGGFASHPKVDPRTGELVFFDYSIVRAPFVRHGVVSKDGELVRYEPIEIPTPHILHDIAITERYTVLLDLPLGWDPKRLAEGKRKIGFDRDSPSRFGIMPRHGDNGSVRWFEDAPCYVYHTINAYEDGDEVVLVACRIGDPIPRESESRGQVARLDFIELVPVLYRWRFNMKTGAVRGEQLDDVPTEFPRVHDGRQTSKVRYSYNPRVAPRAELSFDGVVKYDLETGASRSMGYPDGWLGGEAVFVPRPGTSREDDGWLITCISRPDGSASEAVVIDATELTIVGRARLPRRVPLGFHTCWVPGR